ncbi:hypothetical protein EYF80_060084 [Liparis tanakae]|uniref:Uncharacterized protein n=1 Tax=Liparis tanakae TaxID=230148 RepID=A0A4Z2ELD2_9TELE|nr:hypothetical protein EYF80_060084 [Liparis tanakae]
MPLKLRVWWKRKKRKNTVFPKDGGATAPPLHTGGCKAKADAVKFTEIGDDDDEEEAARKMSGGS